VDRKWWTLIAVCVGTFMLLIDVTIVNVALPDIQSSLKASFSDLQWVVDAYSLMLAALLLTAGSLADLFGRRLLFIIGLVIFTLSSLASGLATTPVWLNLARGAQGIGGAAMFATSLALLGNAFQGRERGTAFGIWGSIVGVAVAIGPVVGGALTTGISWRWIFLVNVPIGVIAVILCVAKVRESHQPGAPRPDIIGVVTFSGALGALVYALIKVDTRGWGSTLIVACLAGAVVLGIAFVVAERVQREKAMFDLSLFRKPTFVGGSVAAFGLSGGLFSLFLYLTLYLQDVLGYSALQTGIRFLVLSGGILLTSTMSGRLTARVPIRFLIAPGLALVGVGLLLMRGLDAGTHWTHLIPGFIVAGAGAGMVNPPLASTAIGVVAPARAGMASGINSTFRQVGIATGIAALGTLFARVVRTHTVSMLHGVPGIGSNAAHALASTISQGSGAAGAFASLPAAARPTAAHVVAASFTTGLNDIFLIGAIVVFVSAALTLVLIRSKDFEASAARGGPPPAAATASPEHAPPEHAPPEHVPPAHAPPERSAPGQAALRVAPGQAALRVAPGQAALEAAPGQAAVEEASSGPTPAEATTGESTTAEAMAGESTTAELLMAGDEALITASEQASRDYERQMNDHIAEHRARELSGAEAESRRLLLEAMARNDRYARDLRRRLAEIGGERERLVAQLRDQIATVARGAGEAALTRTRLYRIIGELGALHQGVHPDVDAHADGSSNGRALRADNRGPASASPGGASPGGASPGGASPGGASPGGESAGGASPGGARLPEPPAHA